MTPKFFNFGHSRTLFIQLDTRKCGACWKCIDSCPKKNLGKVDLPWHKHALILDADRCTGCLMCTKVCEYGAFSRVDKSKQETEKRRLKTITNFIINNFLLITGLAMILSGLAIQFGFHAGGHEGRPSEQIQPIEYEQLRGIDITNTVWGLNYFNWATIHKVAILLFSALMLYHIAVHWKWYTGVIKNNLMGKNKLVITLSALFLLVAVTGIVPWFIDLSGSKSMLRLLLIEIHDKLALILIIYLLVHVVKKTKWFTNTFQKLNKQ
jgi:Pyruvate/2-oxoacid:ferredoxin oxidoreductase delta subunit